jgi:hypothetical protein
MARALYWLAQYYLIQWEFLTHGSADLQDGETVCNACGLYHKLHKVSKGKCHHNYALLRPTDIQNRPKLMMQSGLDQGTTAGVPSSYVKYLRSRVHAPPESPVATGVGPYTARKTVFLYTSTSMSCLLGFTGWPGRSDWLFPL